MRRDQVIQFIFYLLLFVFCFLFLFVFCGVFVVFPNVFLYNLSRLRLSIIVQPILSSWLYTNFQLIRRLSSCCKCLMHNESKPEYWNTRSQPLKSLPSLFEYTSQLEGIWLIDLWVIWLGVRVILCNTIFTNISVITWWSALLVEETGVLGENQLAAASH